MPTLAIAKLPTKPVARVVNAPGAERIIRAWDDACGSIDTAKNKALFFGFLLMEQRNALLGGRNAFDSNKQDDEKISVWLERNCPKIALRTAQRWMQAAERSSLAIGDAPIIEIEGVIVPVSQMLFAPEAELPAKALKYRLEWFEWAADKTIKDCLSAVAFEGEESKRITLAHNGKNAKNAGGGGDRKDFKKFIKTKLAHIGTFLFVPKKATSSKPPHFRDFPSDEQAQIVALFLAAVKKWPVWILKPLAQAIAKELKMGDEERSVRNQAEAEEKGAK